MATTTTLDPLGIWNNLSSAPGTGWTSTTTSPGTSYSVSATIPGSTWKTWKLLYFNIKSNQIWGDLDYMWGSADDT